MLEVVLYSLHLLISEIGVKKQLSNNSGIFAQQMVEIDLFKPKYQKKTHIIILYLFSMDSMRKFSFLLTQQKMTKFSGCQSSCEYKNLVIVERVG